MMDYYAVFLDILLSITFGVVIVGCLYYAMSFCINGFKKFKKTIEVKKENK